MIRYSHFFSFPSINSSSVLHKVATVADFSIQISHLKTSWICQKDGDQLFSFSLAEKKLH